MLKHSSINTSHLSILKGNQYPPRYINWSPTTLYWFYHRRGDTGQNQGFPSCRSGVAANPKTRSWRIQHWCRPWESDNKVMTPPNTRANACKQAAVETLWGEATQVPPPSVLPPRKGNASALPIVSSIFQFGNYVPEEHPPQAPPHRGPDHEYEYGRYSYCSFQQPCETPTPEVLFTPIMLLAL